MLKVECDRWNQSSSILRQEALKANHARTRERLMALYEICNGKSATQVGRETRRNPQTIMEWVHRLKETVFGLVPILQEEPRFPFMGSMFTTMPKLKFFFI
ncbi:helix-turn-helix domain-containing protein [Nostoc sp.]|uniref:helix-turn-helix domain-containing protein n=1 Tax=Nostoc sp. TaxID=1180 RepID=UPI002FF5BA20